jgi:hypothetical protein
MDTMANKATQNGIRIFYPFKLGVRMPLSKDGTSRKTRFISTGSPKLDVFPPRGTEFACFQAVYRFAFVFFFCCNVTVNAASIKGETLGVYALCDRAYTNALANATAACSKIRKRVAVYGQVGCGIESRAGQTISVAEILFECEGSLSHVSSGTARSKDTAFNIAVEGANRKCANRGKYVDKFVLAGCGRSGWDFTCNVLFECMGPK